jgi:hypothetical protein
VRHRGAEIRRPIPWRSSSREPLEFAAANVFEVPPGGRRRRLFVQEYGDLKSFATASADAFGQATQSAIVTPSIGTKGTTSTAPSRGCWPLWFRRSMVATARLEQPAARPPRHSPGRDKRENRSVV